MKLDNGLAILQCTCLSHEIVHLNHVWLLNDQNIFPDSALDKLQNYGVYQTVQYIRSIQVQMLLRSSSPAMYLT